MANGESVLTKTTQKKGFNHKTSRWSWNEERFYPRKRVKITVAFAHHAIFERKDLRDEPKDQG